jgi:hypothetical protein
MGISYSDHKVTITMDKEQDEEGRGSHTEWVMVPKGISESFTYSG